MECTDIDVVTYKWRLENIFPLEGTQELIDWSVREFRNMMVMRKYKAGEIQKDCLCDHCRRIKELYLINIAEEKHIAEGCAFYNCECDQSSECTCRCAVCEGDSGCDYDSLDNDDLDYEASIDRDNKELEDFYASEIEESERFFKELCEEGMPCISARQIANDYFSKLCKKRDRRYREEQRKGDDSDDEYWIAEWPDFDPAEKCLKSAKRRYNKQLHKKRSSKVQKYLSGMLAKAVPNHERKEKRASMSAKKNGRCASGRR